MIDIEKAIQKRIALAQQRQIKVCACFDTSLSVARTLLVNFLTRAVAFSLMLEVKTTVFNLEMRFIDQLKHERLTINKSPNYEKVVNRYGLLDKEDATAEATIAVPESITKFQDAIDYAHDYLKPYLRLLLFAQSRDVYFRDFRCFEVNGDNRKPIGTSRSTIRTGRALGPTYVCDLQEFLNIAVPLLKNEKYNEATGLDHALMIHNEGSQYSLTIEVKTGLFFIGLETLANAYWANLAATTSKTWLFDKPVWSALWQHLSGKLDELSIKDPERSKFASIFGGLKNPPIEEKINMLCESYGLSDYSKEISAINRLRNDFVHGRPTQKEYCGYDLINVMRFSERLLLKLLFKLLNYYLHSPKVHSSVTNNDLSAYE